MWIENNNEEFSRKENWFMIMALDIAKESNCNRKKVWCILMKDNLIVSTWFNWVARNEPDCQETWCNKESSDWCFTIHAEVNAVINAARLWISTLWTTAFVTLKPCSECIRILINAWIEKIFYKYDWEKYEHWHNIEANDYLEVNKM